MDFNLVIRQIRLTLSFLTLLPVCPQDKISNKEFGRSIAFFSLVGVIIGLGNLLLIKFGSGFLSPWLLALILLIYKVVITGGLHLDGLMDCFDGIACGRKSRRGILEVMKDSRVGAFGAMAGTLVLLSQFVCLVQILDSEYWAMLMLLLLILPALSRTMMVIVILFQVKASAHSSLKMFKQNQVPVKDLINNFFWIVVTSFAYIAVIDLPISKLIQVDLMTLVWISLSWLIYLWLKIKLRGHNGDSMGAGLELSETLLLFILAIWL